LSQQGVKLVLSKTGRFTPCECRFVAALCSVG